MSWFLKALSNYAVFSGRARRKEFWFFVLFYWILNIIAMVIDSALGSVGPGIFSALVVLGLLIPAISVSVRRLHDTGKSGWWLLIGLIPVLGALILLIFYLSDSSAGSNDHGPNPKAAAA